MKKIKQAEENEKKQAEKDAASRVEISFFQEAVHPGLSSPVTAQLPVADLPAYRCLYAYAYSASTLQPPKRRV